MISMRNNSKMVINRLKALVFVIPFCLFAGLLLASCSESSDEVEEFADWQNANQTKWNSIYSQAQQRVAAGDTSWKIIKNWSLESSLQSANTSYIVVHVLKEGTGSGCPMYTDSVRVHYKGRLIESTSYPNGYEFDSTWGKSSSTATAAPAQLLVSGMVDGFTTALQNMHIGDEWEVYIPWTLGYGTTAHNGIPAYSILIFDMQLVSYYRPGSVIPAVQAKQSPAWVTE